MTDDQELFQETRTALYEKPTAGVLIAVPFQYERSGLRAKLRREVPEMPEGLDDLTEEQQRSLFLAARAYLPGATGPAELATVARSLHREVVQRSASFLTVAGLLLLYAAGAAGGPWLLTQITQVTWTWGREPPGNTRFREMEQEARQLEKDAGELKRVATALLDQAAHHPIEAVGKLRPVPLEE